MAAAPPAASALAEIAALLADRTITAGALRERLAARASGGNAWSDAQLKAYLRGLGGAASTCGHVFTSGELAYNCRNCQSDGTCVLCEACFKASDHEGHDYSFHLAGPGGCCDCGDAEAWEPAGMCPAHNPELLAAAGGAGVDADPAAGMDAGVRAALHATSAALGRCLQEMTVSVAAAYGRTDLAPRPGEADDAVAAKAWSVVLHNDDVHTYDEGEYTRPGLCTREGERGWVHTYDEGDGTPSSSPVLRQQCTALCGGDEPTLTFVKLHCALAPTVFCFRLQCKQPSAS